MFHQPARSEINEGAVAILRIVCRFYLKELFVDGPDHEMNLKVGSMNSMVFNQYVKKKESYDGR